MLGHIVDENLSMFIADYASQGYRLALVTSGGTRVPIERNTVRFIDNVSTGYRGASLAQFFAESGQYAVIFLSRTGSCQPWTCQLPFLDQCNLLDKLSESQQSSLSLLESERPIFQKTIQNYNRFKKRLIRVSFTTVDEYLHMLELICTSLRFYGAKACIVAAAAVSDYVVDPDTMAEHKIQSSSQPLTLVLKPCRKVLSCVKQTWAPSSCLISFKLETDANLLGPKAKAALTKCKSDVVVGNLLDSYRRRVHIFTPTANEVVECDEVEKYLTQRLILLHEDFIKRSTPV
uniref:DNA/pantothenate metabolism flavoprotein C-terminal domain-containing protein n=1 Tax=Spongospora subterranea TaxID=70186 RepID=A0A0H5R923_9EUKA|eukprot:CRZ10207.1 hypothetical protein [Spongospora subterranea]